MIRNVLSDIGGIATYPIISLVLFVLVFAGAILWAITMRKSEVEHASQLPLEDGDLLTTAKKEHR